MKSIRKKRKKKAKIIFGNEQKVLYLQPQFVAGPIAQLVSST